MSDTQKYVQAQAFNLAGAGCTLGATSITLSSMKQIDGSTNITMTDFGTKGFGTLEPGNGTFEEQIVFTGIVQNANGTATLTGVSNVLFVSPYTETSGTAMSHAGGVRFIITNTAGFYNQFAAKGDDETITGTYTFTNPNYPRMDTATPAPTDNEQLATKKYVDDTAFAGAPNASTTIKGIIQLPSQAQVDAKTTTGSTGAALVVTPATQRSTLESDYVVDTGAADAYVIAPSPAISAYAAGQIFSFKAANTNTTISTVNVNGVGAKTIKKQNGAVDLAAGDIVVGQIVQIEYDGINFQMLTPVGVTPATAASVAAYFNAGDGSDGDVTIAGTTTLTRHMYYNNLTITGTLIAAGFIVYVKGTINGAGTVKFIATPNVGAAGPDGSTGTGGAGGVAQGSYFVSKVGAAGGKGGSGGPNAGTAGGNAVSALGVAGVAGGNGGNGTFSNGGAGGTGGTITIPNFRRGIVSGLTLAGLDIVSGVIGLYNSDGGAGGGGAGGRSGGTGFGGNGGGGGESGGIVMIVANIWAGTFTISSVGAAGGAGGNSVGSGAGGGAGGAGGSGGVALVFYSTKTWTGSYALTGGAGGAAGTSTGGAGGTNGAAGTTGTTGTSIELTIQSLTR